MITIERGAETLIFPSIAKADAFKRAQEYAGLVWSALPWLDDERRRSAVVRALNERGMSVEEVKVPCENPFLYGVKPS